VSGIGPEGRPRSGRRSWTSTPPGACWKTRRKGSRRLRRSWQMGVECVLHDRCPDSGTAPWGVGHPFRAKARHGVLRRRLWWARSISGRPRRLQSGVMTSTTRAHHRSGWSHAGEDAAAGGCSAPSIGRARRAGVVPPRSASLPSRALWCCSCCTPLHCCRRMRHCSGLSTPSTEP
jgi:hypothetical protein